MTIHAVDSGPISPTDEELPLLEQLRRLVNETAARDLHLIGRHGRDVALTESVHALLQAGLESLANDHGVKVHRLFDEISVCDAATQMGVSIRLFERILDHRSISRIERAHESYISFADYSKMEGAHQALDFLSQQGQDIEALLDAIQPE